MNHIGSTHSHYAGSFTEPCAICPRNCNTTRYSGQTGFCGATGDSGVVSVCVHKGEEPCISGESGICNVFFNRCNLRCIYCQNIQISAPDNSSSLAELSYSDVLELICSALDNGCSAVGFVSPSHQIEQMKHIITLLNESGRYPTIVYNSNGYDKVETLKSLEGLVDVYLPDFKYADDVLANSFSSARDYVPVATAAIKEMIRQKGSVLITDENGQAISGVIIRHLVLPGYIDNSLKVMQIIAEEFSPKIHVSLMAQYHPMLGVADVEGLNRTLTQEEYEKVVLQMEEAGIYNGWIQELESSKCYLPDFNENQPFETQK